MSKVKLNKVKAANGDVIITVNFHNKGINVEYNATKIEEMVNKQTNVSEWYRMGTWIIETLCELVPKRFFRGNDIKLKFVSSKDINSFEDFVDAINGDDGIVLGASRQPNIIELLMPEIVYLAYYNKRNPAVKKKLKKFTGTDKISLNHYIHDIMITVCIHELLHAHQYINHYVDRRYYHFNNEVESSVYFEERKFIIRYNDELHDKLRYYQTNYVNFYMYCEYNLQKYLAMKNYYKFSQKAEIDKVKEIIVRSYANKKKMTIKRYKKASVEYILAARIAFGSGLIPDENIGLGDTGERIRELRKMIRETRDIEYDGITWKKNGKYVYGNYKERSGEK